MNNSIQRVDVTELSVNDFETRFMKPGIPIIIKGITQEWEAQHTWVKASSSAAESLEPDWEYLAKTYGKARVPVRKLKRLTALDSFIHYGEEGSSCEIPFSEFLTHWKSHYENPLENEIWYLKDWHIQRDFPTNTGYTTPAYFSKDWLNWWWDSMENSSDDYRFVYMGEKGTWTPMHHDVMYSFSWSANICGRKKWILFPPSEASKLYSANDSKRLVPNVLSYSKEEFPNVHTATKRYEVIQESGEAIFVPSGWMHQVFNLEGTISINHNWFNESNISLVGEFLIREATLAAEEIMHLSSSFTEAEWQEQCEVICKANTGMTPAECHRLIKQWHINTNSNDFQERKCLLKLRQYKYPAEKMQFQNKTE